MKLHIDFDEDLMRKYGHRESPLFFTIYWTHGQMAYPEEGWMDFGAVVLGWWLVTTKSVVDGAREGELPFMDGPFRLKVRSNGNQFSVSATDLDHSWRVPQETLVQELLAGAKRVQKKLLELDIADKTGLKVGIKHLENAVAQQQMQKQIHVVQKQYS